MAYPVIPGEGIISEEPIPGADEGVMGDGGMGEPITIEEGDPRKKKGSQEPLRGPQGDSKAPQVPVPPEASPTASAASYELPTSSTVEYDLPDQEPVEKPSRVKKKDAVLTVYSMDALGDMGGMSPEEAYGSISAEIEGIGESPRMQNMRDYLGDKYFDIQKNSIETILYDDSLSEDQKVAAIKGVGEEIEEGVNLTDMAVEIAASRSDDQVSASEELEKQFQAKNTFKQKVYEVANDIAPEFDDKFFATMQGVANIGTSIIPYADNYKISRFSRRAAEFDEGLKPFVGAVFPGEMFNYIQEKRKGMKQKERLEYDQKLLDAFKQMKEDGDGSYAGRSVGGAAAYDDFYMFSNIFGQYLDGEDYGTFERIIDDAAYGADAVFLGLGGIFAGARAGASVSNSMISRIKRVNAKEGRAVQGRVLASGDEEAAEAMAGMTVDEQLAALLTPKSTKAESDSGVHTTNLVDLYNSPYLFNTEQQVTIASNLKEKVERERLTGAVLQEGNTFIEETSEGTPIISTLYGADKGMGYRGVEGAREHLEELFPKGTNIEYLRETADGLKPVTDMEYKGEVYARINRVGFYDTFSEQLMDGLGILGPTHRSAFATKFRTMDELLPVEAGGAREVGGLAQLKTSRVRDTLTRDFEKSVRKLGVLSRSKVKNLNKMLREVSDTTMTPSQIKTQYKLTDPEYNAFAEYRKAQDSMYILNNMRKYSELRAKGAQTVEWGEERISATPIEPKSLSGRKNIYLASGEGVKKITPQQADNLTKSDRVEMKWWVTQQASEKLPGNAVVAFLDSSKAKFKPLDVKQLAYRPNYYTKIYNSNYIIRALDKETGEDLGAIDGADTIGQAKEIVAGLEQGAKPDVEFTYKKSREMSRSDLDDTIAAGNSNRGLFFSQRGEGLISAETREPLEAIFDASDMLARRVGSRQAIDRDISRFINTYGDLATVDSAGKAIKLKDHPELRGDRPVLPSKKLLENATWESRQAKNSALIYHDDLEKRSGVLEMAEGKELSNFILTQAERLEDVGIMGKWVGRGIAKGARTTSPISAVRRYNFVTMLALNPARMLLLQSMQPLFLMGVGGRDLPASFAEGQKLLYMYGRKQAEPSWMPKDKEDAKLLKSFMDSGVIQNVSQHSFGREATKRSGETKAAGKIVDSVTALPRWIIRGSQQAGFNMGEMENQAITFALARRQYMRDNPDVDISQAKHRDQIATKVREYSLNMDQRGETGYANGAWSIPLQFMSIQHKSLMAWLPSQVGGNPYFTFKQKLALFGAQMGLYGTQGVGFDKLIEPMVVSMGWEDDEASQVALKGGLMDWMLLQTTGEDINVSGSLAPGGSGLPTMPKNLIDNLATMWTTGTVFDQKDIHETLGMIGPTGTSASKLLRLIDAFKLMRQGHGSWADVPPEDWDTLAERAGMTFSSGLSNHIKSKLAMELGYNYSLNTGRGYADSSYAEGVAKFFGIGSHEEERLFSAAEKMYEKTAMTYNQQGAAKDGTHAARLFRAMTLQKLVDDGIVEGDGRTFTIADIPSTEDGSNLEQASALEWRINEHLVDAAKVVSTISASMPGDQKKAFVENFHKELTRGMYGGEDDVLNQAIKRMLQSESISGAEGMINVMKKVCSGSSSNQERCKSEIEAGEEYLRNYKEAAGVEE